MAVTRSAHLSNVEVLARGTSEFIHPKALPRVPLELEAIASEIKPDKSFLNQQFTPKNFLNQQESKFLQYPH